MQSGRRVVVTGLGLVTPLGIGVDFVWQQLINLRSGIRPLKNKVYERLPCRIAGTVPQDPATEGSLNLDERFTEADRRSSSLATLYALVAAEEALRNSQINPESLSDEALQRIGVGIGLGLTDLQDIQDTGQTLSERGYNRVSPYFIPRILPNMASGRVSMKYRLQGPNHCASTACATGAHSIGDSFNFIRNGYADVMVCGGTEACINPLSIATFCRLRALSTKFNADPEKASRPFDSARDGFVMGEGAGILVLEELQHAINRKAKVHGEVLGYGLSGDAYHLTAAREDGDGALRAMQQAISFSKISLKDISYINCHATSTPIGDRAEVTALRKLFGSDTLGGMAISSTKGSLGHLLGAAGAVESILTLLACSTGIIPPSLNIIDVDEECKNMNIITTANQRLFSAERIVALKNSFGFGGTNASICFASFNAGETER